MTNTEIIESIIKVLDESLATDVLTDCWQPIGRSDTYMIRNTLKSLLELDKVIE